MRIICRVLKGLLRFTRAVSHSSDTEEILATLAQVVVDEFGIDAAAVVRVVNDGVELVASRNLPPSLNGWRADMELGVELAGALLKATGVGFARAFPLLIVSGGDLFGALVLFSKGGDDMPHAQREIVDDLVDLAGLALAKAAQSGELARSSAELRVSRETLERAEKLRALGQMAAGISHDLKNIMNPISLHLQFLRRLLRNESAEVADTVVELESAVRRGIETLERLGDFSRQAPETKRAPIDVLPLVRQAVELARARAASGRSAAITICTELEPVPEVTVRAGEFVSAVLNLVLNAIDAMPSGGVVTITTRIERGGAEVVVRDNGPGMSKEVQARVFEPFFTTKGDEGTGLGLAMVFAFMQRHGAHISLDTAPGAGATFRLWFPSAMPSNDRIPAE